MSRGRRISQTLAAGLLGLAVLVGVNILAAKQDWRLDVTADQRNTLSSEAANALDALSAKVTAYAFYLPQGDSRTAMDELLALFARETDNFTYEFVDPDAMPLLARELGVTQADTVVLVAGDKQELLSFPDEEALINGLIKVSDPRVSRFVLVKGHGELDPDGLEGPACSMLRQTFAEQGVQVEVKVLAQEDISPADTDAVLILGPSNDFLPGELDKLTAYFRAGGGVFIALNAEEHSNIEGWAAQNLGVERRLGLVIDEGFQYPLIPLAQEYGMHAVTQGFNVLTLYPTCASLAKVDPDGEHADRISPLVITSQRAFVETDLQTLMNQGAYNFDPQSDEPGPLMLAAAFEGESGMTWPETPAATPGEGAPGPGDDNALASLQAAPVEEAAANATAETIPAGEQLSEAVPAPEDLEAAPGESAEDQAQEALDTLLQGAEQAAEETPELAADRAPRAVIFGDQDFLADEWINTQGNMDMARNSINWLMEREARISITRTEAPADFVFWSWWQLMVIIVVPFVIFIGFSLTMAIGTAVRNRRKR